MFNYSLDFLFFLKCLPPGFCPIWRLVVVVLSPVTDLSALLNVHIVTIFSHLIAFLFRLLSVSSDKCTQLILMWERIGNVYSQNRAYIKHVIMTIDAKMFVDLVQ